MKPKLIALNLLLLAGLGAALWQARVRWNESQEKLRNNVRVQVKPVVTPPLPPAPKPAGVTSIPYGDVAMKDLFSKDRSPVVIPEPPKVEKQKDMPPLPVVYGVLGLPSGTKAIMAEKTGGASKSVRAGDEIGPFMIVSLDPQNVVFEWEGKRIPKKIDDLIDRTNHNPNGGGPAIAAVNPAVTQIGSAPVDPQKQITEQLTRPAQNSGGQSDAPGGEIGTPGNSQRGCQAGGGSAPAGTVVDGYKKVLSASPFGVSCRWVPAQ